LKGGEIYMDTQDNKDEMKQKTAETHEEIKKVDVAAKDVSNKTEQSAK